MVCGRIFLHLARINSEITWFDSGAKKFCQQELEKFAIGIWNRKILCREKYVYKREKVPTIFTSETYVSYF